MRYEGVDTHRRPNGVGFVFWVDRDPFTDTRRNVGELEMRFGSDAEGNRGITEVSLKVKDDHLTPTDLKRFAWDRWLRAADTIDRTPAPSIFLPAGSDQREIRRQWMEEWASYDYQLRSAVGHPGSRGHDPDHYRRVAGLYHRLAADGERAPIKRLAEHLGVSRNTVSGWVRRARQVGFLPKGHIGKAG